MANGSSSKPSATTQSRTPKGHVLCMWQIRTLRQRVSWRIKTIKFTVLPFGLSTAPMVFTKLMRPLLRKWRFLGVNVAVYLDDGIVWAHSAHRNEEAVEGSGFAGG
ncbi:hypothetical protein ANCDUO_25897 [Ancylostoma duodenale]|uniref:Reverse transcriptase domain-containing protein n=1 Tax=Ancylostoma duodenale TaxID=51022 RepID=A0A0C2F6E1_9BILA|nr:hypothetical protein ANCDUO_25897 [Ancylostoma duodenale]